MARLDVSASEIASAVGISRSQLSKMLRGVAHTDIDQLAALATTVGLDPVEVLGEAWRGLSLGMAENSSPLERSAIAAETSAVELGRRLKVLVDRNGLDEHDAYRLVSAAAARSDTWLSLYDWQSALAGTKTPTSRALTAIAQAFGVPPEFLLQNDQATVDRVKAEADLARAATDAGVTRIAARGQLSPDAMREVAALLNRHVQN